MRAVIVRVAVGAALLAAAGAQAAIYTCVDAAGNKRTSDRPIPECAGREQRVVNPDGSTRQVLQPALTADERAEQDARERQLAADRARQQEAVRRDRTLLARYPNEAAHGKARAAALEGPKAAVARSQRRLEELAVERKPLLGEAEFYRGKPLPPKLKQDLDGNDTASEAQRVLIQNQQAEIARIEALYDAELARLKKLWAGATPGSLGPLASASPAKTSASAAAN